MVNLKSKLSLTPLYFWSSVYIFAIVATSLLYRAGCVAGSGLVVLGGVKAVEVDVDGGRVEVVAAGKGVRVTTASASNLGLSRSCRVIVIIGFTSARVVMSSSSVHGCYSSS